MTPIEKLRALIIDGSKPVPNNASDLIIFIDQYNFVSSCRDDIEQTIEALKAAFLDRHESKAGGEHSCYISRITDSLKNKSIKKFNDVHKYLYGHDAMTQVVRELAAEGKIIVVGKKVHKAK